MDYIRLVINIILTVAFYYFFGRVNIATFSQASVSLTTKEEIMTKVPSPGKRIQISFSQAVEFVQLSFLSIYQTIKLHNQNVMEMKQLKNSLIALLNTQLTI